MKLSLVLSEACKNGNCDDCTGIIDEGNEKIIQCEHEHHLNTLPATETLNESLQQQTSDLDNETTTIEPDLPHPL